MIIGKVFPADKHRVQKDSGLMDEGIIAVLLRKPYSLLKFDTEVLNCAVQYVDDTQDPTEDEEQLGRLKEWISSYHLDTIEIADVLSNFPDISVVESSTSFVI